jgi:hypothetical protein
LIIHSFFEARKFEELSVDESFGVQYGNKFAITLAMAVFLNITTLIISSFIFLCHKLMSKQAVVNLPLLD